MIYIIPHPYPQQKTDQKENSRDFPHKPPCHTYITDVKYCSQSIRYLINNYRFLTKKNNVTDAR